jgi:glucan-binding YG repeat protein
MKFRFLAIILLSLSFVGIMGHQALANDGTIFHETDYFIKDATLDDERVFLIRADEQDGDMSFGMVEGENLTEIIPAPELDDTAKILYQSKDHIYLSAAKEENSYNAVDTIYIVNKTNLTYEKKGIAKYLSSFISAIKEKGYDIQDLQFNKRGFFFNQQGLIWIQVTVNGEELLLHKNGLLVEGLHDPYYTTTDMDQDGNIYYTLAIEEYPFAEHSLNHYQIIKVSAEGKRTLYDFYNKYWLDELMVDSNNHFLLNFRWIEGEAGWKVFSLVKDSLHLSSEISVGSRVSKNDQGIVVYENYESKGYIGYSGAKHDMDNPSTDLPQSYSYTERIYNQNGIYYNSNSYLVVRKKLGWVKEDEDWFYMYGVFGKYTGWLKQGGSWYYLRSNGVMATGLLFEPGATIYYLNNQGVMQTGWVYTKGHWYYMNQSGVAETGWLRLKDYWYYLDDTVSPTTGRLVMGWFLDKEKWYYQGNHGMKTGWLHDDGQWYFLKHSGEMKVGWHLHMGNWYFLDSTSGKMQTGWLQKKGSCYFMNSDGAMKTGWLKDKGKWYYLKPDGSMASNTRINGYKLGFDGAWIH